MTRVKKTFWKITLVLLIFLVGIISIIFIFRSSKPHNEIKSNESNLQNKKTTEATESFADNFDYRPIQSTKKEPEYQGKFLPISSVGTEYEKAGRSTRTKGRRSLSEHDYCSDCGAKGIGKLKNIFEREYGCCGKVIEGDGKLRCEKCNEQKFYHECSWLPCGSAILTSSGDLEKQGIKVIIHACPGSKEDKKGFQPTIKSISRSVQNSIILAERYNYENIAFCLIGSNFLDSIISPNQGTKKERQVKLAEIIIKAAVKQRKNLEKIVFVDFGNKAFNEAYSRVRKERPGLIANTHTAEGIIIAGKNKGEKRGITDYSLHKCEAIVNSFNIEGEFINSESFSGFIAKKTGSGKNQIQKEIREYILEFNKRLKK
jgi:hypothetical protein